MNEKRGRLRKPREQKRKHLTDESLRIKKLREDDGTSVSRSSSSSHNVNRNSKVGSEEWQVCVSNLPETQKADMELFFRVQLILRGVCKPNENPKLQFKFELGRNFQFIVFQTLSFAETFVREFDGVTFKGSKIKTKLINAQSLSHKLATGEEDPQEYVYFGNVPVCQPSELLDFVKNEFCNRGLCDITEDPVKQLDFIPNRDHQYAVFTHPADAVAAVEELSGLVFKGSKIITKLITTKASSSEIQTVSDSEKLQEVEPHVEDPEEYVYFGNVPVCQPSELIDFIKKEFCNLGLCDITENPVKQLDFVPDRDHQYAVFTYPEDAIAAVEELNGLIFKGSKMITKLIDTKSSSSKTEDISGDGEKHPKADEPVIEEPEEYVYFGNVPVCQHSELLYFIKNEFCNRGLCDLSENPVKQLDFVPNRDHQCAVFTYPEDAIAAVEELNGLVFKGSKIITKLINSKSTSSEAEAVVTESEKHQKDVPMEEDPEEYVYFGNVPVCQPSELLDFIKTEFCNRGLCEITENPVKQLDFVPDRDHQYAVFTHPADAVAAEEELNGLVFKGSKIITKLVNSKSSPSEVEDVTVGDKVDSQKGEDEPAEEESEEIVCFGNVPVCQSSELLDFIKTEFCSRGLCDISEDPVKQLDFVPHRDHQYAVFTRPTDAIAAVEELNGLVFKGSKIITKLVNSKSSPSKVEDATVGDEVDTQKDEPVEEESEEIVCFGNVPVCQSSELVDFIKNEFCSRGLCDMTEDPVKRLDFVPHRDHQYAVFTHPTDAIAAVEELNGLVFKGSKIITKLKTSPSKIDDVTESEKHQKVLEDPEEYVYFGNVPVCQPSELIDFIKKEFCNKGLCDSTEDPVKRLDFVPNRDHQYAVFSYPSDAIAAVEELNGLVFKGSKIFTKASQNKKADQITSVGSTSKSLEKDDEKTRDQSESDTKVDWLCPNRSCGKTNKGNMIRCRICRTPNPNSEWMTGNQTEKIEHKEKVDWFCPSCSKINFAVRNKCRVCDTLKPFTTEISGQKKKTRKTLFVGGIPSDMPKEDFESVIVELLVKKGVCEKEDNPIQHFIFKDGRTYQFIMFSNEAYLEKAINAMDGAIVNWQEIEITLKCSRAEKEFGEEEPQEEDNRCKVAFENLSRNISQEDLELYVYQALVNIDLFRFGHNPIKKSHFKPGRSFQYIEFYNEIEAQDATEALSGFSIDGLPVKVHHLTSDSEAFQATQVHISNLTGNTQNLKEFLLDEMVKHGLSSRESDPISEVLHFWGKGFAFAKFRKKSVATRTMIALDGVMFNGRRLRLAPGKKEYADCIGNVQFQDYVKPLKDDGQKKAKSKIHLENVPKHLSQEDMVRYVVNIFLNKGVCTENINPIQRVHFESERNFQFLTLFKEIDLEKAVNALHGVNIAGQPLKASIQTTKTEPSRPAEYTVFIGNVSVSVPAIELKDFILRELIKKGVCTQETDPILAVKMIFNKPYAFVAFDSADKAREAVKALKGIHFYGYELKPNFREEDPTMGEADKIRGYHALRNVCVGNLPLTAEKNSDKLKKLLESELVNYGVCSKDQKPILFMKVFPNKPYQLATFQSYLVAKKAVPILDGLPFEGKNIKVQMSEPVSESKPVKNSGFEVFIGRVPKGITLRAFSTAIEEALIDNNLCKPEETIIHYYRFEVDRCFQYVNFYKPDDVARVIPILNGLYIGGKPITASKARRG